MRIFWRALMCFYLVGIVTLAALTDRAVRALDVPPAGHVIVRTVQATGSSADHELVEIYNPLTVPVDVTNWSLMYYSASGATSSVLVNLASTSLQTRILLAPQSAETFMTEAYVAGAALDRTGITIMASGLNHTGGSVVLFDAFGQAVDSLGWGTATIKEGVVAKALSATTLLQRMGASDTNDNDKDFVLLSQDPTHLFSYGNLSEVVDVCSNFEGLQLEIPTGLISAGGNCIQPFIPADIILSEILPNPDGDDRGEEFIELYNNTNEPVDLADYRIRRGVVMYGFPDNAVIEANGYGAWSDADLGLTLANTTGGALELVAYDGQLIDQTEAYANAPSGESWQRLHGAWQYTDQPTRGTQNLPRKVIAEPDSDSEPSMTVCKTGYYYFAPTNRCRKVAVEATPAPCKEGQYRSEETGRCRNIALAGGTLVPCKEGQHRSEETNRCRSLASAIGAQLKPCADDQFRNPATGRCKKIASSEDMPKPCKIGWERNPDTNRCRKIKVADMPVADFPVESIAPTAESGAVWWAISGLGSVMTGYGVWEWRRELRGLAAKVGRLLATIIHR